MFPSLTLVLVATYRSCRTPPTTSSITSLMCAQCKDALMAGLRTIGSTTDRRHDRTIKIEANCQRWDKAVSVRSESFIHATISLVKDLDPWLLLCSVWIVCLFGLIGGKGRRIILTLSSSSEVCGLAGADSDSPLLTRHQDMTEADTGHALSVAQPSWLNLVSTWHELWQYSRLAPNLMV